MTLGVIQARMGSTRLPGKALKPLGHAGMPSLWYIYRRMMNSKLIDKVIIATTTSDQDKIIKVFCKTMGITCVVGDEHNLIKRMKTVIDIFKPELIVDVTGDCPLVDPKHIAECVKMMRAIPEADYCSNIYKRFWPDGFDVQVYRAKAFLKLVKMKEIDPQGAVPIPNHKHPAYNQGVVIEHTGWNFLNNPAHFCLAVTEIGPSRYYYPKWKLTLDTEQDFIAIDTILKRVSLTKDGLTSISAEEIIDFVLANPDVLEMIRIEDEPWKT